MLIVLGLLVAAVVYFIYVKKINSVSSFEAEVEELYNEAKAEVEKVKDDLTTPKS